MKITFCGAAGTTTGSKHLIEVNHTRILLDCGLYQGRRAEAMERNSSFPFDPEKIDCVVLSHAHIDHMGTVSHFHDRYATPAYLTPPETAPAHRDYLEQAGELDVAKNIWRPGVLAWSLRITRAGATQKMSIPHA